ncbi:unnamed protein product [Toxocara canis]|uniref:CN hydrolase domain-containing protein n=1 Tax=Toxocara canis TaxID=6265 RepID=A0A183U7F1_TOXCA|nr:unnamed protein product [Toxocara canis]
MTGDFVIAERSPTHQIQIYDHCGQFMRRFGANVLEHPRGICVDNKGRIIVVECKVRLRICVHAVVHAPFRLSEKTMAFADHMSRAIPHMTE